MKVTTDFWTKERFDFDKLLYINGQTREIMFQADLNNPLQTYQFFEDITKFAKSKKMRKTINANVWNGRDDNYQFAVISENEVTHVKWFDLVINENLVISHDIAFETTLIKKNDLRIPLGSFPIHLYYENKNIRLPKYREFNLKARAYKFMGNQVKSLFTKKK